MSTYLLGLKLRYQNQNYHFLIDFVSHIDQLFILFRFKIFCFLYFMDIYLTLRLDLA